MSNARNFRIARHELWTSQPLSGGKYVCIYNKTRERFVATHAEVADGYFSRLVGLLGRPGAGRGPGRAFGLCPSHGVHTIGMLYALDLIFLDRHNDGGGR